MCIHTYIYIHISQCFCFYGSERNPKYVSEIIKQFIIQGKECYPNLFTYQSDWLAHIDEFGLTNDYVVTYTGQRFYAPNTKESPVKRAILKGKTLVNICNPYEFDIQTTGSGLRHIYNKYNTINIPIQDDKQYSIWIEIDINEIGPFSLSHTGAVASLAFNPILNITLTSGSTIIYPCVKRSNSTNDNISIGALEGSTEG